LAFLHVFDDVLFGKNSQGLGFTHREKKKKKKKLLHERRTTTQRKREI